MKRLVDLVLSIVAIVVLLPVWVMAAVLIYCADPGPIFFRQRRIGLCEAEFDILKFRTMFTAQSNANTVTTKNDPRIIFGGHFLRKFKIDELPQLFNVLNGTMSLVGPRPTVRDDFNRMTSEQKRRFAAVPGLTGLAQVSGNTALTWNERIKLDLIYIEKKSVWLDIKIILRTAFLIFVGRADTHPPGDSEWE